MAWRHLDANEPAKTSVNWKSKFRCRSIRSAPRFLSKHTFLCARHAGFCAGLQEMNYLRNLIELSRPSASLASGEQKLISDKLPWPKQFLSSVSESQPEF